MLTVYEIICEVEDHYSLPRGSLVETSKLKTISKARRVAYYIARNHTNYSWNEISDGFHRHHSTIANGLKDVSDIAVEIGFFNKKYKKSLSTRFWNRIKLCIDQFSYY